LFRLTVAVAACLAAASLVVAPQWVLASPAKRSAPCAHGYSYGGYASRAGVTGIAASVAARDVPTVTSGHAAAWVGVGGIHQGPGGSNEWLQTGLAAFPGRGLHLYVEEVSPGQARQFVDLGRASVGRRYRVAVEQTAPDIWEATVDGRSVGRPAYLPTGGGAWRGVATAESWSAGRAACNAFSYRFDDVSVSAGSSWRPLADARVIGRGVARTGSGFSARS
jgi:hypothetical protein